MLKTSHHSCLRPLSSDHFTRQLLFFTYIIYQHYKYVHIFDVGGWPYKIKERIQTLCNTTFHIFCIVLGIPKWSYFERCILKTVKICKNLTFNYPQPTIEIKSQHHNIREAFASLVGSYSTMITNTSSHVNVHLK